MSFLDDVAKELDMPQSEKEHVLREIRSHYTEIRNELVAQGMDSKEADKEAGRRLGSPESIAVGLGTVHTRDGWKTTLLALLPFLAVVPVQMIRSGTRRGGVWSAPLAVTNRPLVIAGEALLITFGLAMLIIAIRELLRDRRPTWLAPFLAGAISWPLAFVHKHAPPPHTVLHLNHVIFICWITLSPGLLIACTWIRARKWRPLVISSVVMGVAALLGEVVLQRKSPAIIGGYSSLAQKYPVLNEVVGPAFAAVFFLTPLMLLTAAALMIFVRHTRSIPSKASLFAFSEFVFFMMLSGLETAQLAVTLVSTIAAVFTYSRVGDRRIKYAALFCGATVIIASFGWWIGTIPLLAMAATATLIPAVLEFRSRNETPLIAH
jgi:hypothetical protein